MVRPNLKILQQGLNKLVTNLQEKAMHVLILFPLHFAWNPVVLSDQAINLDDHLQ